MQTGRMKDEVALNSICIYIVVYTLRLNVLPIEIRSIVAIS